MLPWHRMPKLFSFKNCSSVSPTSFKPQRMIGLIGHEDSIDFEVSGSKVKVTVSWNAKYL